MGKALQVLRHEAVTMLTRPSFLLVSFGLPMASLLIFGITSLRGSPTSAASALLNEQADPALLVEGYVDHSGLVRRIPDKISPGHLIAFPDEGAASQALASGQVSAYYVVPEDYLASGELVYVHPEASPFSEVRRQDWTMRWTLLVNLLDGDLERAERAWNPADLLVATPDLPQAQANDCPAPGFACESNAFLRLLPLGVLVLFYLSITFTAGLLLQNLAVEKQNRVLEVLLLSASPRALMAGKIAGIGLMGLLQIAAWLGTGFWLTRISLSRMELPFNFDLPFSFLFWGMVFFLLGYAIYASLIAGAGALISDTKASASVSFLVMIPLHVGYLVTIILSTQPHGWLAVFFSLFPLTAPTVMMWRLVSGNVPLWQPGLAAVLAAATAFLVVRMAARLFHAQTMLSGQPFSLRRYLRLLVWH